MATTYVRDYTKTPIDPNLDLEKLRSTIQNWLEMAQGDSDKSGTIEDCNWYDGQVSVAKSVLKLMIGEKPSEDD